jgi:staphylococcal nuclease domain-containing protein 1
VASPPRSGKLDGSEDKAYPSVLHLAGTTAPRVGTASRDDEPFAFPAREFLRSHLVGKEVAFTVTHTLPSGGEFATVLSAPPGPGKPPQDVATLVVENGWAKARDNAPEALKEAEARAQAETRGLWAAQPDQLTVAFSMPADPHAFIAEHSGELDAIVEQVRDGTQLRVRLLLDENTHQIINLVIAGAKSPRASVTRDGETQAAEPWGEEAKFFTEARLLQRHIKVRLLSAPVSLNSAPFQTKGSGLPAPAQGASFIIGQA